MSSGKLLLLGLIGTVFLENTLKIFFVLTKSCRAQDSDPCCDQTTLGTMSFEPKYSFITPKSVQTRSAPGYRITKHIEPSALTNADLEKYVENQNAIKAYAISNNEPVPEDDGHYRVKVYIYCPPCACQVATALDICHYRDKKDFIDFYIRIDHRQKTSCSASASWIEGLVSIVDHLKDKERSQDHSMGDITINNMKALDREWIERQVYDYTEEDRLVTLSSANQLARIAKFHLTEPSVAAIILLGEADYCVPLMGVPPFRPFESGRLPRETQLFKNWQRFVWSSIGWHWEREYIGTFSSRAPLPPRRPAPVDSNTTEILESAQRGSKRPRSSTSDDQKGS